MSKRIPDNFVEETWIPFLEDSLLEAIHVYVPHDLAKIAKAYTKIKDPQPALCQKLADTMKFRMVAFEAVDIVDAMPAMWKLTPGDAELWEMFTERLKQKVDDLTVPNILGVLRIYNKMPDKQHGILAELVPRLTKSLEAYNTVEICELVAALAMNPLGRDDPDILTALLPEIQKREDELDDVQAVNLLWSLTRLGVFSETLVRRIAMDMNVPDVIKDIPPRFIAKVLWVFSQFDGTRLVENSLLGRLNECVDDVEPAEFARIAMAVPHRHDQLKAIITHLKGSLMEMRRSDMLLFLSGCVHCKILEEQPSDGSSVPGLLDDFLDYLKEEQDNFKRDEIDRAVRFLHGSDKYKHLIGMLPASWNETVNLVVADIEMYS